MGEVLELAERAWTGSLGDVGIHPGQALVGFEELDTGLGFMSAFSNVCALDTDEGLVFVDTSSCCRVVSVLKFRSSGWTNVKSRFDRRTGSKFEKMLVVVDRELPHESA